MTTQTRFDATEWATLTAAPLLSAMFVIAAEPGGVMRETLAVVRGYQHARGSYDSPLLAELTATPPADATRRPHDPDELRRDAPVTLRAALAIVDEQGSHAERDEYRRFVAGLAQTAVRARQKGGLLRRRRPEPSERTEAAVAEVQALLDA